ncbi:MAG: YiiD C-terminal domain-containing protein [Deltaproteobacteria bacterium]|nr:YiiD C-terminal domain-containing protein [Deltaproteobacteria bacterium]
MIEKKYEEYVKILESIVKIIAAMGIRIIEMWDRHVKVLLPLEPNINHIGTMYAGSLFTVGEFIGGAIFIASFDYTRFYPIVKAINIQFRRPATTLVTVETTLSTEEINAIQQEADAKGKADWEMNLELKDQAGEVCCLVQGVWQMRKLGI